MRIGSFLKDRFLSSDSICFISPQCFILPNVSFGVQFGPRSAHRTNTGQGIGQTATRFSDGSRFRRPAGGITMKFDWQHGRQFARRDCRRGDSVMNGFLRVVAFSHGYSGSPLSSDYIPGLSIFASYGYVVIAPFHGDLRFSDLRIEDLGDVVAVALQLSDFTAMQALRPLSISAALDLMLALPQWQSHPGPASWLRSQVLHGPPAKPRGYGTSCSPPLFYGFRIPRGLDFREGSAEAR